MIVFARARKHAHALVGLLNVAVAAGALQVASVRATNVETAARPSPPATAHPAPAPSDVPADEPHVGDPGSQHASRASAPLAVAGSGEIPIAGKGMWIWLFKQVEGGDPVRIVRRATSLGLSHLYVRSSSTTSGLKFLGDIDAIVPVAHAAGIKVIAWDFPTLKDPYADARRLIRVIDHRTPGGDRVDGIAVDLETPGEGVSLSALKARRLALTLKRWRPTTFRVLVPPRPTPYTKRIYPYGIIPAFDAVAPMVYWHHRDAGVLVSEAVRYLKRWGRPVAPIGQAYDSALDPGGKPGAPSPAHLLWFAQNALREGAVGVSFWSWQHTSTSLWGAIGRINFPSEIAGG